MINKKKNRQDIEDAIRMSQKYNLDELSEVFNNLQKVNEEYKVHILLIGGYSAGKSALLNKYMGKKLLKEDQCPETDIATELHFSENEKIVANMKDGSKVLFSSKEQIDIDDVKNLEYFVNSENIKRECDYILVDTPGFDSGIEKHNKALMQYIDEGTAFFLVVDCEKGTISESTLAFLSEMSNYSQDIAVIISKCDKKLAKDVENVKLQIEDMISMYIGKELPIITTSIYDETVGEKLRGLIRGFDSQELYDKNMYSMLQNKYLSLLSALEIIKENVSCDTQHIDKEIEKREIARIHLQEQLKQEREKLKRKLNNEIKYSIIGKIREELISNIDSLASSYEYGVDYFKENIIELIRPVMIREVENSSEIAYKDILQNINCNIIVDSETTDDVEKIINSVYNKLNLIEFSGKMPTILDDKSLSSIQGIYKAIATIVSITTNVVAPIIEVVLVFLPDIISMLRGIFGETKEEKIKKAIRDEIIPKIVMKMDQQIGISFKELEDMLVQNIESSIKLILDSENEALEQAKIEKAKIEDDHKKYIEQIETDIEFIQNKLMI